MEGNFCCLKAGRPSGPIVVLLFFIFFLPPTPGLSESTNDAKGISSDPIPILLYHRFGPQAADSMTVTMEALEAHLKYIKDKGYTVIRLRQLVDFLKGMGPAPPQNSLAITVDDGHRSVYTELFPLIQKYRLPVTLFIYPSAISNAPYAMTWGQLREMQGSGLVDIQSHMYWHPNFKKERKKMDPEAYASSVRMQLMKSRAKLERELGVAVDMISWPFGIHDEGLRRRAAEAGYIAGFTMERRSAGPKDDIMALPRYLITGPDKKAVSKISGLKR